MELFGGLQVACEPGVTSGRVPKSIWVIVALCLSPGYRATDVQLEQLLFTEESLSLYDTNARLRQCIKAARTLLGNQDAITRSLGAYVLNPAFIHVDFLEFEAAAAEALQSRDPESLQAAALLYQADGNLLEGFRFPSKIEHPHILETEARLREKHAQIIAVMKSVPLPKGRIQEKPTAPKQRPFEWFSPQERKFAALALIASVVSGISVYALDPLALPPKKVKGLLNECGRRLIKLQKKLKDEMYAPAKDAELPPRPLPSAMDWSRKVDPHTSYCIVTRSQFAYNESLGGMSIDRVRSPERTILFYEGNDRKFDFRHQGHKGELITLDGVVHVVNEVTLKNYSWGELKDSKK